MLRNAVRGVAVVALGLLAGCAGGASADMMPAKSAPEPPAMSPSADVSGASSAPGADREGSFGGAVKEEDARLADNRPAPAPSPKAAPATPSATPEKRPDAGEVSVIRAPLLIYTAQITLAVFEVNLALGKVEAIGRELGGFLAKRDDTSITIRVPAARFDEAVKRVEDAGDMLHRNVSAQDVTEEFRDLEVRLKSAYAVRQRLTELLSKAVKVEESIAIERELDRVSGEIERIEGRMKFLKDRAAFSTLTVTFQPKTTETVVQSPVRLPVPWLNDVNLARLLNL